MYESRWQSASGRQIHRSKKKTPQINETITLCESPPSYSSSRLLFISIFVCVFLDSLMVFFHTFPPRISENTLLLLYKSHLARKWCVDVAGLRARRKQQEVKGVVQCHTLSVSLLECVSDSQGYLPSRQTRSRCERRLMSCLKRLRKGCLLVVGLFTLWQGGQVDTNKEPDTREWKEDSYLFILVCCWVDVGCLVVRGMGRYKKTGGRVSVIIITTRYNGLSVCLSPWRPAKSK